MQPRFSPDGKTLAFSSDRSGIENIWLADADGKNPRALTTEKDSYVRSPSWTPDGQYVLARKEDGKRAGIPPVELWMYHREGGGSGIKLTSSDDLSNAGGAAVSRGRPLDLLLRATTQVRLRPRPRRRPLGGLALRPRARGDASTSPAVSAAPRGPRSRPTARR